MKVGGHNREVDYESLGPTLVVAASMILAIRTAKWNHGCAPGLSNRDWEQEAQLAVRLARITLTAATGTHPSLFRQKDVPWYVPDDGDIVP